MLATKSCAFYIKWLIRVFSLQHLQRLSVILGLRDTNLIGGFLQGLAGYAGVIFFLIRSFKSANVLYVNGLWDGISGIVESLAAILFLGDRLEPIQYAGLVFIFIGIFLLKAVPNTGV